ncbi:MAG: PA0069 family radical SAM protein [Novosphingobium sp.]
MAQRPPLPSGRGAPSAHVPQRFGLAARETDGDWLDERETIDGAPARLRTTVTEEQARSIISFNRSPDVPFDRSINAYRGCEHGCIYCFARPTHAYHDLSPGLDFETRLFAKPQAATLLRKQLAKAGYRPAPIAMGTNTDPYQPIERRYRLTRAILEVCLETRHPVTITTKSDRIVQDLDILTELARAKLVAVSISVTSLDPCLSLLLEPRAAAPAKRVSALEQLSATGIPTHVAVAPIIPAITDCHLETILERAVAAGVQSASWIMLRLPHEVAPLFREWLDVHYPDRAGKVMGIIRSVRSGRDNDPRFFSRMKPQGVWAELFRARFRKTCARLGLNRQHPELDSTQFRPPDSSGQLSLF